MAAFWREADAISLHCPLTPENKGLLNAQTLARCKPGVIVVNTARGEKKALCIQGGATKDFYGEAPAGEPLSTRALSGISAYEPSELVVTVRAGTPIAEVEAELARRNQYLAFEPPRYPDTERPGQRGGTISGSTVATMIEVGRGARSSRSAAV